ncbi:aminopeptidase P family protein [Plectonema cf. radiosum LEGE 06105]|uniref:Xaa-Pro aminopeptidase n=1 Tax=Plectonema cf. radiosum LEGE 06105 TaxID=945769 RepID=A0A8J7K2L9_9CYAN|nr:aminopeptidase P family protein [Plectonema radiosum]MBE9213177.1 aminopeptidase P family protein [Plectonema cf. radiosum LEGE 06105]
MPHSNSLADILRQRREKLAKLIDFPAVLWSGSPSARNFAANIFPHRSSSHFLYFAGLPLQNAAIRLEAGKMQLFMDDPAASSALWHGEMPNRDRIAEQIGADEAYPIIELEFHLQGVATIAVQDAASWTQQSQLLDRWILPQRAPENIDLELAKAIVELRLTHDQAALTEIRKAVSVTVEAHKAGMAATSTAKIEAQVRAAMEAVIIAHNMTTSYNSIVTVRGEVLHNEHYGNTLQPNHLLLADVGAETSTGWAADVTRTWAVNGKMSSTQRDIYDIVLAAHDACIDKIRPGVEYEEIHLCACRVIAEGLVNLGILQGSPEELVDIDAHALFFPHGIGHLLGLDVHDMEDLGDLAGYETGRERSSRFGLGYLRLNRPLRTGMLVTIEPGFYQVPAIINNTQVRENYKTSVNWERLTDFSDVRGIRIEDDVLVTDTEAEVLTAALPTQADAVEQLTCQ